MTIRREAKIIFAAESTKILDRITGFCFGLLILLSLFAVLLGGTYDLRT
jgi:uncharacterized membrane protein required for colicin V production